MKYLVNRETKEHRVYADMAQVGLMRDWDVVEADEEGWIPWSGGECPLPDGHAYNFTTQGAPARHPDEYREPEGNYWGTEAGSLNITAYLPILETPEKEEPRRRGRTIALVTESPANVFDRLKSAIAASESIPAIIAEIDALLPDGYCVAKREEQPVEDMSDWRNWREGDLVECISTDDDGAGDLFEISIGDVRPITGISEKFGVMTGPGSWGKTGAYRFHSRPAKVTK